MYVFIEIHIFKNFHVAGFSRIYLPAHGLRNSGQQHNVKHNVILRLS